MVIIIIFTSNTNSIVIFMNWHDGFKIFHLTSCRAMDTCPSQLSTKSMQTLTANNQVTRYSFLYYSSNHDVVLSID